MRVPFSLRALAQLAILPAVLLAACRTGEDVEHPTGYNPENVSGDSANTVAAQPGVQTIDSLEAEKQGVLSLEGTQEPITLKLFQTPEAFPLPFYTYHPEDLVAQIINSGVGSTARFTANMGGRLTNDAYVEFFYYPNVLTADDARVVVREKASDLGEVLEGEEQYPWSLAEYPFRGDNLVGRYILGERNGRYFHILIAYPPEFGDGFGPRAHVVLSEWRWLDGAALAP